MEKTRKLTSNEKKVRKKLEKFPQGIKAMTLAKQLRMCKTVVYEALSGLEQNKLAFKGKYFLWFAEPPSTKSDHRLGFLEKWRLAGIEKERLRLETINEEMLFLERRCAARREKGNLPKELEGLAKAEKENEIYRKYKLL